MCISIVVEFNGDINTTPVEHFNQRADGLLQK